MKFRSHFDYDVQAASDEARIPAAEQGESLTIQSMTEDADLSTMLRKYVNTGQLPVNPRVPSYGDFTGLTDYRSALHAIMDAQDNFMLLDAKIRARFNNDPQEFLEFCTTPGHEEELTKLGLMKEKANGGANTASGGASGATGSSSGGNQGGASASS